MPKAPAAEQLKLLDLQALDAKLRSLDVRRRALEADPRLGRVNDSLASATRAAGEADRAVRDGQAELVKAEDSVAQVAARIERDEARLYAGGLSKDLQALQQDIAALSSRRSDLEDAELEILERLDGLRAEQTAAAAALDAARAASSALRAELDAQIAEIAEERVHVAQDREAFAARIDGALVEVYEKTLAKRGVGAARLFHGTSEGSGMALSPGDLAAIRGAAEDDIVFCPDSGCILVRSPEWV
ncbi:C4-type zinc ribbon domain-containing protein [Sinomonas sp. JGH33]|uniref:C4-type zinc ribbon domain-containing protein n=1 Tax=Sinomonas terricola TaxID=3110330 RepID=A0ABU5TBM9_9MICC|nr:C4-type zinc ribbon domain-containing protein [Sinomonas sp. JGH33]MEA5456501.1 C4-type zinc ribbon domain-containing protein [Sinomonas sp. JGH33]